MNDHDCRHEDRWDSIAESRAENRREHAAILEQVTRTNGRIRALEVWRTALASTLGGMIVGATLGPKFVAAFLTKAATAGALP